MMPKKYRKTAATAAAQVLLALTLFLLLSCDLRASCKTLP
jgi:hypothetical protein